MRHCPPFPSLARLSLAAFLLILSALPARAFDYTYVEGGTAFANGDSPNRDGPGPWFALSLAAGSGAHLFAHYTHLDLEDKSGGGAGPVDEDAWGVGLGANRTAAPWLDVVVRGSYDRVRTRPTVGPDTTRDGLAAEVGFRLRLRRTARGPQEVNLGLTIRDLEDRADTVARAGVVMPLTRHIAVTGDVRDEGDRWQARAGLRVGF